LIYGVDPLDRHLTRRAGKEKCGQFGRSVRSELLCDLWTRDSDQRPHLHLPQGSHVDGEQLPALVGAGQA
jgi:hypothetical protein